MSAHDPLCAHVDPKSGLMCGFRRESNVHAEHDEHEAHHFPGPFCNTGACHAFVEPRICRRCGEPADHKHVQAPSLCAFETDREKVSTALRRASMKVAEG